MTPAIALASAERDLVAVRQQMYALAAPLYAKWFPDKPLAASLSEDGAAEADDCGGDWADQ